MDFFISGFLVAFTMLTCVVNLQESDKVHSIFQIYLTGEPFIQGKPITLP